MKLLRHGTEDWGQIERRNMGANCSSPGRFPFVGELRGRTILWLLIDYFSCFLDCFTILLKNQKQETKVKWPLTLTLNLSSGHVCSPPSPFIQYGGVQFVACG